MEYRLDAEVIITGTGDILRDGSVVVDNNKLTYVGEQEHAPTVEETKQVPIIMPGMWDTHAHFSGFKQPQLEQALTLDAREAVLRATWDVREVLQSGFTSIREVGGFGIYLNKVIMEGLIPGPRIYASGKVIGTTGGHSDIHNIPLDVYHALSNGGMPVIGELADGKAECLKAVRTQIRAGAEVIKYCASGGVMSEIDHPVHQQFSQEEQQAIVEEAQRAEIAVAAHCHGAPGIRSALEAGVKTIEHGTYLSEELAEMMVEKDVILVPTRYVIEQLLAKGEAMGVPDYAMAKITKMGDQHASAVKIAIQKGVKIALGTDIFVSGPGNIFRWGDNAQELVYLTELGMSNHDAIIAATSRGPETLGHRAPQSGRIEEGYDADLLTLTKNPLDDISVLTSRENIAQVIKQGQLVSI